MIESAAATWPSNGRPWIRLIELWKQQTKAGPLNLQGRCQALKKIQNTHRNPRSLAGPRALGCGPRRAPGDRGRAPNPNCSSQRGRPPLPAPRGARHLKSNIELRLSDSLRPAALPFPSALLGSRLRRKPGRGSRGLGGNRRPPRAPSSAALRDPAPSRAGGAEAWSSPEIDRNYTLSLGSALKRLHRAADCWAQDEHSDLHRRTLLLHQVVCCG